jgi:hypothetical protein
LTQKGKEGEWKKGEHGSCKNGKVKEKSEKGSGKMKRANKLFIFWVGKWS